MKTIVASNNTSALSASAVNYMSLQANTVAAISATEGDVQVPMPIPGNYSDLWIDLDTQPGTGKSWKVTLRVNGADSSLFATVSDTGTAAHLTGTNVAISIGDLVCVSWTPSGTPAVPTRQAYSCVFTGTNAGESFILMNRVVQQASNTLSYYAIQGDGAPNATETSAYTIMPTAGILDQMYVAVQTAPGGAQTDTFTFRKNATDQSLSKILTGATTSDSDLVNSVSVAQGDTTSVKIVTSATAAATRIRCSMRFRPTVDGESLALMPHNSTLAQNATVYRWFGHTATNATETLRQGVMPYAAILKKLFIQGNTVANGQTNSYTVRKNAADPASGLTCTITGNAGGTNLTGSDNTNTVTVAAGDLVDLKGVSSATASSVIFGGGMVYYIATATTYNQSLSATSSGSANVSRETGKSLSDSSSAVATITRAVSRSLSATSTAAASCVKQTAKTFSAASSSVAMLVRSVGKILSGSSVATATLLKGAAKFLTLSASSVSSATLARSVSKSLSAVSTATATLLKGAAKFLTLSASSAAVAALTKQAGKSFAAASASAASLSRSVSKKLTAVSAGTATLGRSVEKSLAATSTSAATLQKSVSKSISAVASGTARLARSTGKNLAAASTGTVTLGKSIAKTLSAASTATATFIGGLLHYLTLSAVSTATASIITTLVNITSSFVRVTFGAGSDGVSKSAGDNVEKRGGDEV